jgi:hypothetical protein
VNEYREVRLRRNDRPYEIWRCSFETTPRGQIARCGVCREGAVEPRVDATCGSCGATVTYVYPSGV